MQIRKLIGACLFLGAFLIASLTSSAQFRTIGYVPSWQGEASAVQYSKVTHINYAFVLPTANGGLQGDFNAGKLQTVVSLAHQAGVKVLISVGGWNDGNDSGFETLAASSTGRTNFTNAIMSFVNQYNLDGADIDWEYPDPGNSAANYVALMTQLSSALHAQGKLLTAAVVGTGGEGVSTSVFAQVDFLNLMAYDFNNYDHSTYAQAQQSINYWKGRGLPSSKCVLGVPFYGRPSWETYATLVNKGADPYSDTYGGVYYNGITTMKKKVDLAYDNCSGIMIWELTQDLPASSPYSLLNAIYSQVLVRTGGTGGNKAPTVSITSPSNNASFTANATVNIAATAADADGSVTKVEFYYGSTKLGEDASSPYTYSWANVAAGTYNLTAKATDNAGATTVSSTVSITVGGTGNNSCDGIPAYIATEIYTAGKQVVYNGRIYTAQWWTQNEQPDTHTGSGQVWKYERDCGGGTNPGNQAPSVNLTSPASGASFTAPASVTISASASDADGSISKVEFYNGGTKLGESTSAPYSYTWSNVAAGNYSITAKATDNAGGSSTSGAANITVGGGGNTGGCAGVAAYAPYPAIYNVGDRVSYNGYLYESLANSLYNVTPGTADYWWKPLGACSSAKIAAAAGTVNAAVEIQPLIAYPNPVTGSTLQLQVNAVAAEKVYIQVWSVDGTTPVLQKVYTAGSKGQQVISLDITRVPQGTWIIRTTNAKGTRTGSAKIVRM